MRSLRIRHALLAASALLAVAVFACGGRTSALLTGGCFAQAAGGSDACTTCVQTSCGTELTAQNSQCSALEACVCPNGVYESANAASCTAEAEEGTCPTAGQAVDACALTHCAGACTASQGGSSGSSSGGSSGGSSSGTATVANCIDQAAGGSACINCVENECSAQFSSLATACSAFVACLCPNGVYDSATVNSCLSLAEQPSCQSASEAVDDCESQICAASCASSIGGPVSGSSSSSSSSGSSSGPGFGGGSGCVIGSGTGQVCTSPAPSSGCANGGAFVPVCPFANLAGCCTIHEGTSTAETCTYDESAVGTVVTACLEGGGSWSTVP